MGNSTAGQKPRRATPLYGLRAHNNGKFYKRFPPPVGFVYFGTWADPDAADREYGRWAEAQRQGVPVTTAPSEITLAEVADRFVAYQEGRVDAGEIQAGQLQAYHDACIDALLSELGGGTRAADVTGHDLERFRKSLRARLGGHQTTKILGNVKAMFRWASESRPPLVNVPLHRDHALRRVSAKEVRREQRERHQKHGKPYFRPSEVRLILDSARNPLKAMILLAVNVGLGQRDVGELEWSFLKLRKRPRLDYVRRKTELARQAALWPETVAALVELRDEANRPKPLDERNADRVFLTRWGRPFWYVPPGRTKAGRRKRPVESISSQFQKLLEKIDAARTAAAAEKGEEPPAGLVRPGRGFRAFRRTFSTIADRKGDKNAKRRIMGQQLEAMDPHYVMEMPYPRLRKVTEYVRRKILRAPPERAETRTGSGPASAPAATASPAEPPTGTP